MLELSSFSCDGGDGALLEAVCNPPTTEVVGGKLNQDAVSRKELDEVDPDVPAEMGQDFVTIGQLHFEHIVRQRLGHLSLHFNRLLLCHTPSFSQR